MLEWLAASGRPEPRRQLALTCVTAVVAAGFVGVLLGCWHDSPLTTWVRSGERMRLDLKPPARLCAPVVRTAVLEWSSELQISAVPPRERLAVLCSHRTARLVAGDLRVPLAFAAVPILRLRRPRTFDCLPALARALVDG